MNHLRRKRNISKITSNGNIKTTFKIIQWNKGNFHLITKINEPKHYVKDKNPFILIVNELNPNVNEDQNITNISLNEMNKKFDEQLIQNVPLSKAKTFIDGYLNVNYEIIYKN